MVKKVHVFEEINIPDNVDVEINGLKIRVKGPRGEVSRDFSYARDIIIRREDDRVIVEAYHADREKKALVGSIAAHINNMIKGVTKGFRYRLKIIFSHFPISVEVDEKNRVVRIRNFLGEKADRYARIVGDARVRVEGEDIVVEGNDIEQVSQTAANIEMATKVRDKDRRVFTDGIYIYERGEAG